MKTLFLEDLSKMDENEIKGHIADEYAGDKSGFDYGCQNNADKDKIAEILEGFNILIAYESVGSWGCDSSSYFLLQDKKTAEYKEFSGSHCSCYGFEGQFDLQDAPIEYLKGDKFYLPCGGYDESEGSNKEAVARYLSEIDESKDLH